MITAVRVKAFESVYIGRNLQTLLTDFPTLIHTGISLLRRVHSVKRLGDKKQPEIIINVAVLD
jgi:hypothetical protein